MTIKVGDTMPTGTLKHMTKDGPQNITSDQLFKARRWLCFRCRVRSRRPAMQAFARIRREGAGH